LPFKCNLQRYTENPAALLKGDAAEGLGGRAAHPSNAVLTHSLKATWFLF
jgi:hypothetical protein